MHLRILLAVVAMASLGTASSRHPDCETSCGDVTIPFPFGLTKECYHNSDFFVNCSRLSGKPIPLLRKSNIEITNISIITGEMEVMAHVAHDCYYSSGETKRNRPSLTLSNFWISSRNRFIAIGCDTHAYVSGRRGNETIGSGCISTCDSNSGITNGSCSGVGCCEIAIPEGMSQTTLLVSSYSNHTNITGFNPCSYAFVVEQGKYNFSSTNLLDFGSKEFMPRILEWAIGNLTCKMARMDTDNFLCKGNSDCDPSYAGDGYRCRCLEGYIGNPYLLGDCKNINECQDGSHDCELESKCNDTTGNYTCICPKGYTGDGRKSGGSCKYIADESRIVEISVGTSAAAIFLLIFVTWLYLGLKKRKLMILREKYFKQNGGLMLQQRISGDAGSHDQAKVFTIEELKKATNNYDESRIIGKGGYGTVYKGVLSDNRVVAIKKSKLADQTESQIEQFINEVVILSQINHRNVVKLIGCCLETEIPSLVYEFISNGTLSDHIYVKGNSSAMTWDIRLRIATETAEALSYLHSSASVPCRINLDHTLKIKV